MRTSCHQVSARSVMRMGSVPTRWTSTARRTAPATKSSGLTNLTVHISCMKAGASRYRRLVHARKPRWLLSGALASLAGYVALAVLAAHQQFFAVDYGTRTWMRILREETPYLPMALVTELGCL